MPQLPQLRLLDDVHDAGLAVAPSWPLSSVIAVNPLAGFEDRPYAEALAHAEALFGSRGHLSLAELRAAHARGRVTDEQLLAALAREVTGLADLGTVAVAGRPRTIAEVLLVDLVHGADDPSPVRTIRTVAEEVDERDGTSFAAEVDLEASERCLADAATLAHGPLPELDATAVEAHLVLLAQALDALRVPAYAQRSYLEAHVAAQPGWAAHLRWYDAEHGTERLLVHLTGRVAHEAQLVEGVGWWTSDGPPHRRATASARDRAEAVARHLGGRPEELDALERALLHLGRDRRIHVWIDAYERAVHDPLLAAIAAGDAIDDAEEPAGELDWLDELVADVVACIDVRSEGIRRHLEARGGYRTYGYAGFFGLPFAIAPLTGGRADAQCPVLLTPATTIATVPAPGAEAAAAGALARARAVAAADDAWHAAKLHPIAPLALAEGAGWLAGPIAAARTATPGAVARLVDRRAEAATAARTRHDRSELPVEDQAGIVAAIWRLGMHRRPAPLVVLTGHGARVDNNPMESGLACGACGGHRGGPNAQLAAAMANDPAVRAELATRGIDIPETTWFVAAEHETATDQVVLLDVDDVPASHRDALARLQADLEAAGEACAIERAGSLPGASRRGGHLARLGAVRRRGRDWAEPVAELGLAGNHAFVIGPRRLTAELDLGRRVFLHSYEADLDADGTVLGGILTAPLVVAQWINAQYNLSTTDPEVFGSGTKALHNVVGDLGVLSGPGGDLRRGLPLQSVRAGDRLLHEPVRLLAIVEGRREHVDAAIAGSATLQQLIGNEWISLVARSGPGDDWQQRTGTGWELRPLPAAAPEQEGVPSWAIAV